MRSVFIAFDDTLRDRFRLPDGLGASYWRLAHMRSASSCEWGYPQTEVAFAVKVREMAWLESSMATRITRSISSTSPA